MRQNSATFDRYNQAPSRELRLVLEIGFPVPLYLASHSDIPNLPANAVLGCIRKVSSTSQRLLPEQGRAEIGAISFELVDVGGQVTYVLGDELDQGSGLKGKTVRLYQGGGGMDWADFRLEQTQVAEESLAYGEGVYKVRCRDIQREMRKDLFVLNRTKLSADFAKGASTLPVFSTANFEPCPHYNSNGDAPGPGASYYYLKIKYQDGYEIVRASGKTATSFTGCVRARFGTREVDHTVPTGSDSDRGIEVEEYVYLEMPAPALAYALLTGDVLDREPDVLPGNWHLGIDPQYVDRDAFLNVGRDWFDPASYKRGRVLRFTGLEKADGKQFIEQEINLLLGAYMPVSAAGQLGFRRMTGVLSNAATVATLTEQQVVGAGDLQYDLAGVRNVFGVQWSWFEAPGFDGKFLRTNNLLDADSITTHGAAKPLALKFRGLHNSRHTYTSIKHTFDALRDRYAGPPLRLRLDLLPSQNDLEVGDVVRVVLPNTRDHSNRATETLDRAMEIQRISVDQVSQRVTAELFGSYQAAGAISDQAEDPGPYASAELPDSWYSSAGTEMTAAGLSIDASGFMTADGSLAGAASSRTVYYYLGDLTVPAGTTLTVADNVELRVMGVLQVDGSILGTPTLTAAGFVGSTYGGSGQVGGKQSHSSSYVYDGAQGERVTGRNATLPPLALENDAGELLGIPDDLRGSGGAAGGNSYQFISNDNSYEIAGSGGAGGAGGAGLVVVARGVAFGVSGVIDTSGADGSPGIELDPHNLPGGSGGGGAPGGVVLLVDGNNNPFPVLTDGKVPARYGASPASPGNAGKNGGQMGTAAVRVAYVPKSRTPYEDESGAGLPAEIAAAQQAAAAAQASADDAQADASDALDDLGDIAADGVLHPTEKLQVIREKAQLDAERASLVALANSYGLTAARDAYTNALDALTSYLGGLSPAWDDKTQATAISRTVWNSNWQAPYQEKVDLLQAAADEAGKRAKWSQTEDDDGTKPEDGATANGLSSLVFDPTFSRPEITATGTWVHQASGGEDDGPMVVSSGNGTSNYLWVRNAVNSDRMKVPCKPGDRFYARARVKADGLMTHWTMTMHGHDASGNAVEWLGVMSNGSAGFVNNNTWQTVEGFCEIGSVNSNTRDAHFYFATLPDATAGTLAVDSVEIWKVAAGTSNAALEEGDILNGTGWQSLPEDGATKNTGVLADLDAIDLGNLSRTSNLLPRSRAARELRNEDIALSSDGYLSYDFGSGPVNLGAVSRTGLGVTDADFKNTELTSENVRLGAGWTNLPSDGANKTEFADDSTFGRITLKLDGATVSKYAVSQSEVDSRADSRIGSLRPDSNYKNSNTTKSQVGLGNVDNESSEMVRQRISKIVQGENLVQGNFFGNTNDFFWSQGDVVYASSYTGIPNKTRFMRSYDRDSYADEWFPVKEGERYLISGYIRTYNTSYSARLGLHYSDKYEDGPGNAQRGSTIGWLSGGYIEQPPGQVFSYFETVCVIPAGYVCAKGFFQINGPSGSTGNAELYDPRIRKIVDNQRSLPLVQSDAASVNTSAALTASDNGTTAKITIASHTRRFGSYTRSYNSGSITGLPFSTKHWIYFDDPGNNGGAVTYYATTSFSTAKSGDHRLVVGGITTPADGGGSTSEPDPDLCVDYDTLLPDGRYLRDVQIGDLVECIDVATGERGRFPLLSMDEGYEDCYALRTAEGAEVWQSESTPMDMPDGGSVRTPDMLGRPVYILQDGVAALSVVSELAPLGRRRVLKPNLGDRMFFAGVTPGISIATHNAMDKP